MSAARTSSSGALSIAVETPMLQQTPFASPMSSRRTAFAK